MIRLLVVSFALLCPAWVFAQQPPATAGAPRDASLLTLGPSVQALASPEKAAIAETLERYFEGFDAMDADLLSSVLHRDATFSGGVGQPSVEIVPYARTLDQVRRRPATPRPAVKAARTVTDVFVHGEMATAVVHMTYLPPTRGAGVPIEYAFQLFRAGDRWAIVSVLNHAGQYAGETDEKTLDAMGIRPGMTIGEIGARDGRVTFALARKVGDRGRVYANDIDPKPLETLRATCERQSAKNIETLVGKVDDPMFPQGALDLAIMAIVYHHLEQPVALLKNLATSLKPGATVVIVDPAYDRTGDKDSDRPTTRERVESEAGQAGYELIAMDASLPRDNIFILRVKTGGPSAVPRITATPWEAPQPGSERTAVIATLDAWWKGHDTEDAALLEKAMAPGTRSWFVHEGELQFVSFDKEVERIKSGNRRPGTRPLPGEKRSVVDFRQESAAAVVTMLVEIPRGAAISRNHTTFQLYKADDRWQIVNMAGMAQPTIHDVAARGDLQAVKALLDADPTLVDVEKPPNKKTALHYAAENGHVAVAAWLLDKGANVNRPNIAGETALHYAVGLEDPAVVNLLLGRGANANAKTEDGTTPLRIATAWGHLVSVKALLDKGADAREVTPNGQTLLHVAATAGDPESVSLFVGKGADVNAAAKNGDTPLLVACRSGNATTAAALLDRGADPNKRDASGRQPLEAAVNSGQAAIVERLLDAGARPGAPAAADKRSALHFAAARGWLDITNMLLAAGADRGARDIQGRTPLGLASRYGNRRVADALAATSASGRRKSPGGLGGDGKPAPPPAAPRPGEATAWFLGHMGWAVRTANHFLVFDYDGRGVPPDEPSLANGSIDPTQIADLPTTVFITHSHDDHYAPGVFEWKKTVKDITYVAGFKPKGKEGCVFMGPRETKTLGGLEIATIKAADEGVGFFVKVDGVTVFHSGDHVALPGRDDFAPEIDFMADRGLPTDLLIMPVSMPNFPRMNEGVHYAMKRLSARAMFPSHLRGREQACGEFARDAANAGVTTPVHCPEFGGDHFTVAARPGASSRGHSQTPRNVLDARCRAVPVEPAPEQGV